MPTFRLLPLLVISAVLLTACSDDEPTRIVHHVNPLWTPDGKTLVAGYDEYLPGGEAPSPLRPASRIAVMDVDTRVTRVVDLGTVNTWHTVYAFDPSGSALAIAQANGIFFFDLQGRQLLAFQPTDASPRFIAFGNTGNSFVWVGATADGYTVNKTTYDAAGWTIGATEQLAAVTTIEAVISLALTSQRSYALRFASGLVREVEFNGTELNSFTIETMTSDNPWHERLVYYSSGGRYLYAIDGKGMMRMDLGSGTAARLVQGTIVDLDISDQRRSMVYETRTGDLWLSSEDGIPLTRLAPQNIMPRFSPAANGIAMITRVDTYTDSLHVLLYR